MSRVSDRVEPQAHGVSEETANLRQVLVIFRRRWRLFLINRDELKKRVADLLVQYDGDFFDEPTRPDIPALLPDRKT